MDCIKPKTFALGSKLQQVVHRNATKSDFLPKNPSLKKGFVCQCGSGRIYFHWPNLILLAKSIFTCQIYSVKNMMYVPVPPKLTFF